jgi:hypothetical protein
MGIPFENSDQWIRVPNSLFKATMALSRPLTQAEACLVLQWKYWIGEEMTVCNVANWTGWNEGDSAAFLSMWKERYRIDLPQKNEAHI